MRADNKNWTPDLIQTLRALWAEGLSTAAIGVRLGFSKNAIVGKAHRLSLPARPSPIARPDGYRPPKIPRKPIHLVTATGRPAAATIVPRVQERVLVPERRRNPQPCCWPLGEPGQPEFRFCCTATTDGRPYCSTHSELAYVKSPARRQPEGDANGRA